MSVGIGGGCRPRDPFGSRGRRARGWHWVLGGVIVQGVGIAIVFAGCRSGGARNITGRFDKSGVLRKW